MFRSRSWFGTSMWKPKNPHSLEHLKYLYNVLSKNQVVSENNRGLLVESLRSIAEILIWGDQNDSSVFDFFLEKNMLSFFLKIMKQKCGSYVCVQLLQTLNILFENIRNETSLYYLLSNNHVNSIIVHKFDFSDEEVMAYYISFLKTLSLKLNAHTIHFFYNEHTNDFPLYTEAIQFFNHPESMVRIAVRTLTLNVYRVEDRSMQKFIRDRTAAPYFSNLVWFIGNHVLELDSCVRNDADHQSQNRLSDLVAEHLDHLHYLNDILCLDIADLNKVLTDHLLNKLLIPLYVYSLTKRGQNSPGQLTRMVRVLNLVHDMPLLLRTNSQESSHIPSSLSGVLSQAQSGYGGIRRYLSKDTKPHVSSVVSLFLLSQVFLIITHKPLVEVLANIIINSNMDIFLQNTSDKLAAAHSTQNVSNVVPRFVAPTESLEKCLETSMSEEGNVEELSSQDISFRQDSEDDITYSEAETVSSEEVVASALEGSETNTNITDEEKEKLRALEIASSPISGPPPPVLSVSPLTAPPPLPQDLTNKPFLETVFNTLSCVENDYAALFALCLLYALGHNKGVKEELLDAVLFPSDKPGTKYWYNVILVEKLIEIISLSCSCNSRIRLVTLELSIRLLIELVMKNDQSYLRDCHLAAVEGAREESTSLVRNFYKSEEIFLDMFEDEYSELKKRPLNVEWLMMDSNILLPPTGTPMTGIEFNKRLPCGEVERARRAIRVFFLIRELSLTLRSEPETQLPLTSPQSCVQVDNVLDLNNSDLIACTVVTKDSQKIRRFLVMDVIQLILVEPDLTRLGWGVAKFVGFLQDIEVTGDKDDSRCLHITIHRPLSSSSSSRVPLLSARFVFDDHIRCMAAKQRLSKGRIKARQKKMQMIARLLDLPSNAMPSSSPVYNMFGNRTRLAREGVHHRPLFTVGNKVPGFASAIRRESVPAPGRASSPGKRRQESQNAGQSATKSREGSPRLPRPRSEEIPLEDMGSKQKTRNGNGSILVSSIEPVSKFPQQQPQHPVLCRQNKTATPSADTENLVHTTPEESAAAVVPLQSEETSFTRVPDGEDKKSRRKGKVETV